MQRHDIWRRVQHDYHQALERATEGYEPFVQIYVAGRDEPIALGFVETGRVSDEIWVRLEAEGPAVSEDEPIPPECYWVHVRENTILGLEVRYRIKERPTIGFSYTERDD